MSFPVAPGADAFGAGALIGSQVSWKDRLREAAYTSPSGTRITFEYTTVSREVDRRATVFEFPGVDGAFVQQGGFGARRYPLRCMFHGPQHDLQATAFEAALLEPGVGKLEHPLYGGVESVSGKTRPINVVPLGTITRSEDLAASANFSVVEVTFSTTLASVYPSATDDPQNEILALLGRFNVGISQQFAASTSLVSTVNKASAVSTFKTFLKKTSAALTRASDAVAGVRRKFSDAQAEINGGIDVLIGQPILLAQQCVNLVLAPSRAAAGIALRLECYQSLLDQVVSSAPALPGSTLGEGITSIHQPLNAQRVANDFHISGLFAASAAAGTVSSLVAQPLDDAGQPVESALAVFSSRASALQVADAALAAVDQAVAWRDSGYAALSGIVPAGVANSAVDTGEAYEGLLEAARMAAAYAVKLSFSLLPERRIYLDRDRTIVDLCAELYGSVDDKLDLLISTNNLTGSQILELPKGMRISYYPGA